MAQINNWGADISNSKANDLLVFNGSKFVSSNKFNYFQFNLDNDGTKVSNGAGAGTTNLNTANYYNSVRFDTGTTNTGYSGLSIGRLTDPSSAKVLITFEINLGNLSTISEEYAAYFGAYSTSINTPLSANFWGFKYDRLSNANWLCSTANGGTETATDSGVAVSTATVQLQALYDTSVPNVKFYINNILVATNTTNLPTGGSSFLRFVIIKSAGTTSRSINAYSCNLRILRD